jgi:hypothetical protein
MKIIRVHVAGMQNPEISEACRLGRSEPMGTSVALILDRHHHVAQPDLTPSFAVRDRTALVAKREAGDDMFGDDELARTVANEIDQQRAACAKARLAGVDREEEEDAISELDISEDELTTSLLHL